MISAYEIERREKKHMFRKRNRILKVVLAQALAVALLLGVYPYASASGGTGFQPLIPQQQVFLFSPHHAAIDGSGNIYVTDTLNNRIVKLDSSGRLIAEWGGAGSGNGQLREPYGIAIDQKGGVYVADTGNHRIQKFSSDGSYLFEWGIQGIGDGQFNNPVGIAISPDGNVYVAEWSNSRIQKFDPNGAYLAEWGSYGYGNGQFRNPIGIAIDRNGDVYVTETEGNRVQKFDSDGAYLAEWGSIGNGNGQFDYPRSIAIDGNGKVYIGDSNNHRIQVFSANGTYLEQWGSLGDGSGQFRSPGGIALDGSGNIYVVDSGNGRIQKFDSNTAYVAQWGSKGSDKGQFNEPSGIAISDSGNVYVADRGNHRIQQFTPNGSYLDQWGSAGNGNGQFNYPSGIAVDSGGNFYVADSGNDRIQKFDSNGAYLTQWGSGGVGNGQLRTPSGIAVDSGGNVYVSDTGNNRIQKFDSMGNYILQWGMSNPSGIAVDDSGNVYVADPIINRIQIFASDGTFRTQWDGSVSGGRFSLPHGVAVDGNGNIYVADSFNNRIQKFTPDGKYLDQWGTSGQFNVPTAIVLDRNGNVYVADKNNHRIQWLQAAAAPTTDLPDGAVVANNSVVTMGTSTAGATIYYTTNGKLPSTESASGTSAVIAGAPGETVKLQAYAATAGMADSPLMSVSYTIDVPAITPPTESFDKNTAAAQYRDVNIALVPNGFVLSRIVIGAVELIEGIDYVLAGNAVKINKEYLASRPIGTTELLFDFGSGTPLKLTIAIQDTTPVPGAPYLHPAIAGDGQVSLTWSPVAGSTGYTVYQSVTSATYGTAVASVSGSVNSHTVTGLANGTTYYFTVKATNYQGDSPFSNMSSATPFTVPAPDTEGPSWPNGSRLLLSDVTETSVKLSWPAALDNNEVAAYRIFINGTNGPSVTGSVYEYVLSGLSEATTYHIRVKAYDAAGNESSNELSATAKTLSRSSSNGGEGWIPSDNARLKELNIRTDGKLLPLNPAFAADRSSYSAITEAAQAEIEAIAAHLGAKITLNGKAYASRTILDLNIGSNVFEFVVQAENGTKNTYTIDIKRQQFAKSEVTVPNKPTPRFSDIGGHWAERQIIQLFEDGYVNGYKDGTFKPNRSMTKAEFVHILAKVLKLNADDDRPLSFTDAEEIGSWARDGVAAAAHFGLIKGQSDGSFGPDERITREEMAVILARALDLRIDELKSVSTDFVDDADISKWAKGAIAALKRKGFIQGTGNNRFNPHHFATRAEAASLLLKLKEK